MIQSLIVLGMLTLAAAVIMAIKIVKASAKPSDSQADKPNQDEADNRRSIAFFFLAAIGCFYLAIFVVLQSVLSALGG